VTDLFIGGEIRRSSQQARGAGRNSELLRVRRHVKVQADDNFEIFGPDSLTRLWDQVTAACVSSCWLSRASA